MTLAPITLRQGNAETIRATITRDDPTDDLATVTKLQLVLKASQCVSDSDSSSLVLSTTNSAQMIIVSQTSAQIVVEAYIPSTALASPYSRWWRIDAYVGTIYRTALYGPVTVIDL